MSDDSWNGYDEPHPGGHGRANIVVSKFGEGPYHGVTFAVGGGLFQSISDQRLLSLAAFLIKVYLQDKGRQIKDVDLKITL